MFKKCFKGVMLMTLIAACSHSGNPTRDVASHWNRRSVDGAEDGVYLTKKINDRRGEIGVLREFGLMRDYDGDNLKGLLIEVQPNGGMERRAQIDVILNGRTLNTHNIMLRRGHQHLYTDINQIINDDIRQLQLRYNPIDVEVQEITVLVNEDERNGGNNDGAFTQIFSNVDRRRGGGYYTMTIPRDIDARYLSLEAMNYSVTVHDLTVDGVPVIVPNRSLFPGSPVEIMLPSSAKYDIRIRAEGNTHDSVGLKATVSEQPTQRRPDPIPGPNFPGPNFPGPNRPGPDRPHRGPLNIISAYSDDNCSRLITAIDPRDNCQKLETIYSGNNLWSVSVNDTCINVTDRRFVGSCEALRTLANEPQPPVNPLVRLFSDDNCSREVLNLDHETDCGAWMTVLGNAKVWSVSVDGRCLNIPDVSFSQQTCDKYRRGAQATRRPVVDRDAIELFTDDNCTKLITSVQRGDRCDDLTELFGSLNVWSIKFRGRCENISDLNFSTACQKYAR